MVGFLVRNTHTGPQIPPAPFLYTAPFLLRTLAYVFWYVKTLASIRSHVCTYIKPSCNEPLAAPYPRAPCLRVNLRLLWV